MKYYYKVVAWEDDKLVSAVCNERELGVRCNHYFDKIKLLKLKLIYKINAWTISKNKKYGITIFESLKKAKSFHSFTGRYTIFKCEAIGVRKPKIPIEVFRLYIGLSNNKYGWPEGTLMADKIKLIKEV